MGGFSLIHWLLFAVVALLVLGGGGRMSAMMGDLAKGIKEFKKGMADDCGPTSDRPDPESAALPNESPSVAGVQTKIAPLKSAAEF